MHALFIVKLILHHEQLESKASDVQHSPNITNTDDHANPFGKQWNSSQGRYFHKGKLFVYAKTIHCIVHPPGKEKGFILWRGYCMCARVQSAMPRGPPSLQRMRKVPAAPVVQRVVIISGFKKAPLHIQACAAANAPSDIPWSSSAPACSDCTI